MNRVIAIVEGYAEQAFARDVYGMPESWPGRKKARKARHAKKAATVEQAILDDVADQMGAKFNRKRFLP